MEWVLLRWLLFFLFFFTFLEQLQFILEGKLADLLHLTVRFVCGQRLPLISQKIGIDNINFQRFLLLKELGPTFLVLLSISIAVIPNGQANRIRSLFDLDTVVDIHGGRGGEGLRF